MALSIYGTKVCPFSRMYYCLKPIDYNKFYSFANYTVLQNNNWKRNNVRKFPSEVSSKRFFWEGFPNWSLGYLHEKDKLSRENHEIVYRYGIFNYVFYSQIVSMSIIAVQIYYSAVMVFSLCLDIPFSLAASTFGPYTIKFDTAAYLILSFFSLQNMMLFKISQSTPLRIYYNEKENIYVYIFLGINPFGIRHVYCKPGDLQDLGYTRFGMFLGNFKLKDHRIMVQPNHFRSNEHFNRMLGEIP